MHIPDGYLSPQACAVGFAVAAPFWVASAAKVKGRVKTRNVPTLAVLAATCFLIMMFNVPIPDGTTAHAVGGALVAILLGPWAAVTAVGVAPLFQALLFGDGGHWLTDLVERLGEAGRTIVHATYDLAVLDRIADRAIVFSEAHRVVADATPREVLDDRALLAGVNLIHDAAART